MPLLQINGSETVSASLEIWMPVVISRAPESSGLRELRARPQVAERFGDRETSHRENLENRAAIQDRPAAPAQSGTSRPPAGVGRSRRPARACGR